MLAIVRSRTTPLVNRCQSFLQKAIGDPVQAREAASIRADLTLALERLNAHDDKINSKLDSLTIVSYSQYMTLQRESSKINLYAAPPNAKPNVAITSRTNFVPAKPAEPNPRTPRAAPSYPPIRSTPHRHRAQCYHREDSRRLPVHQALFRPHTFPWHYPTIEAKRGPIPGVEEKAKNKLGFSAFGVTFTRSSGISGPGPTLRK